MKTCAGCNKRIWPWQKNNGCVSPMHIDCWKAYVRGGDDMRELVKGLRIRGII